MLNPGDEKYFKYVAFDVVDYSKRSTEVMESIIQAINDLVPAAVQQEGVSDENWLRPTAGDAVFIALHSQERFDLHMRIALALLRQLSERNERVPSSQAFQIRIGIYQNTDKVVLDLNGKPNIAGDGINIAQRVMNLADANQILVGYVVHAELRSRDLYRGKFVEFKDA
jgi:class 3 adenylate cyclase